MHPSILRTALVTGGARRIGRAIAESLAEDGFAVVIHCHDSRAEADSIASQIRNRGGRAAVAVADLSVETDVETLLPRASTAFGAIGLLVNNASVFERDDLASATRASWDRHMEPNLRAPFVLSQSFARQLPPDAEGLIVNLIDERVWNLTPHFMSYTISKAALWTLTRTLALALAPRIRVCAIGPGPTLPSARQTADQFARQAASVPLQRPAELSEFAAAMRFLIAARSFTGQMLALDGGQHLSWGAVAPDTAPEE